MNILWALNFHRHYWGIPHERTSDHRIVQTCYACARDREMKVDLRGRRAPSNPMPEDREFKDQ